MLTSQEHTIPLSLITNCSRPATPVATSWTIEYSWLGVVQIFAAGGHNMVEQLSAFVTCCSSVALNRGHQPTGPALYD